MDDVKDDEVKDGGPNELEKYEADNPLTGDCMRTGPEYNDEPDDMRPKGRGLAGEVTRTG
jgi:hypothetical protein